MRLILFALVVMAWTLGPVTAPTSSTPAAKVAASERVDFDALHEEARAAMERLRQLQERRVVTASAAAS